jgi:ABC-type transport system substrate-binding protein
VPEHDGRAAPDAQTVSVTFKEPYAPWASKFFQYSILPQHVLQPEFDKNGTID